MAQSGHRPSSPATLKKPGDAKPEASSKSRSSKIGRILLQALAIVLITVLILAGTLFICLRSMCSDSSPAAQRMFVTTILETGQLKFLASWFLSPEEIQEIVNSNSMEAFDEEVDDSLINVGGSANIDYSGSGSEDYEPIEIHEISGNTYYATLMIVKDPSKVSLATIYPWRAEGVNLDVLVKDSGAVGGINGGIYNSYNNSGGAPFGVVVSGGEIQYNEPTQLPGLVLIGLTEDNILQIISLEGMYKDDVVRLVEEKKIRDAVCFQEESSDSNNHFVQLVINGEARELNGMGSGLNPRTAIGQRADGAILMLVTDGRGKGGHLGASASDLINVMLEYGAVNAANLDGGSSSCMYYDEEYLMTSVTFYYSNASWKLPCAFVVHE